MGDNLPAHKDVLINELLTLSNHARHVAKLLGYEEEKSEQEKPFQPLKECIDAKNKRIAALEKFVTNLYPDVIHLPDCDILNDATGAACTCGGQTRIDALLDKHGTRSGLKS